MPSVGEQIRHAPPLRCTQPGLIGTCANQSELVEFADDGIARALYPEISQEAAGDM